MVNNDGWAALQSDTSLDTIDQDQQQSMAVLHTACLAGYSNIVSHLLSLSSVRGLVNSQDSCGNTALMDAARAGHLDCVKHLLAIDTRLRDKMGRSAVWRCLQRRGPARCCHISEPGWGWSVV